MIRTRPVPIGFLTDPYRFYLGRRIKNMLQEPFDREALQKRVLRKSRNGDKAEMAYYIDTRALAERLDQVVGPMNWNTEITDIVDCGDRICTVATLTIGGKTYRQSEGEELKFKEAWSPLYEVHSSTGEVNGAAVQITRNVKVTDAQNKPINEKQGKMESQELVFMKAGPQARKRAAVEFGVGAYLYGFSDVNTWEEIDQWGSPKDPNIDMNRLPEWARPTPGPALVAHEMAYFLGIPVQINPKDYTTEQLGAIKAAFEERFGIKTISTGLSRADYIELASVIARISDYLDIHGGSVDKLLLTPQE